MESFWNQRYHVQEYVYGTSPNIFFSQVVKELPPGKIILPCEGEGRNAVFAASLGWETTAFDSSETGKQKALTLALKENVAIDFVVGDAAFMNYSSYEADVVALIFAHLPPPIRTVLHKKSIEWLKPGGKIILEAFNSLQLNNNSGGPKDIEMLYSKEMLQNDFLGMRIDLLEELTTILNEGSFHNGKADIIRLVATKV